MSSEGNSAPVITVATDLNDYFEGRVSDVLQKQKREASQEGRKYLAAILAHFALAKNFHLNYSADEGLDFKGHAQGEATSTANPLHPSDVFMAVTHFAEQQPSLLLKHAGDYSLYVTGFFPASRKGRWFNEQHFKDIGIRAYETLSTRNLSHNLKSIFKEMSHHFVEYTRVISEIQLDTEANHQESVSNLFESWTQHGNQVGLEILLRKGLVPINPERKGPN